MREKDEQINDLLEEGENTIDITDITSYEGQLMLVKIIAKIA